MSILGGPSTVLGLAGLGSRKQLVHITVKSSESWRETLPFSEVKAHLSELADRVERQHDRILVTRNGRPSFVLLSPDDLESLEESLDILKDDELMESLRRSRKDAEEGKRLRLQDHV